VYLHDKTDINNIKREMFAKRGRLYRKAVRDNELFFVIKVADIYSDEKLKRITGKTEYCH